MMSVMHALIRPLNKPFGYLDFAMYNGKTR